jgi:hypothetical protein
LNVSIIPEEVGYAQQWEKTNMEKNDKNNSYVEEEEKKSSHPSLTNSNGIIKVFNKSSEEKSLEKS